MNESIDIFNNWDKYKVEKLLGQGAYGNVYEAVDLKLNRTVALKILNQSLKERILRFRNEALNQAKVDHPNICKVYEVGSFNNINYIAMQFINGKTLDKIDKNISIKEKVKIIKKVANGLHAAHLTGLIHRDIKPTNIMVKEKAEGGFIPYITDFGIAKQLDSPAMTKDHLTTGSPNYMSPEQASGERYKALDIRTDIYSLGVTLYELLTGKLPHSGMISIEVMFKIINKEPEPICKVNKKIPKDLGSIVMKCLEKEPNKRYESAKELAEDLDRFLNGNPVKARSSNFFYKIKKRIIKHPVFSFAASILIIAIILLSSFYIKEKVQIAKKVKLSEELGRIINNSEKLMRISHMMKLHNIQKDKEKIAVEIKKIEEKMKSIGKLGKGPGFYALGKCYLILGNQAIAKEFFEKALKIGYSNNDLYFQLGLIYGQLYVKNYDKLSSTLNKRTFKIEKERLKKLYLNKSLEMFSKVKNNEKYLNYYGKAFINYIKQDYSNAEFYCKKAIENANWYYEAYILSSNIRTYKASLYESLGKFQEANKEYDLAQIDIKKAIDIAESDINCHKAYASLWIKRFTNSRLNLEKISYYKNKAIESLDNAKLIDPENSDLYVKYAICYWHWAEYLMEAGKEFGIYAEKGIKYGKNAIKLDPYSYEAFHHLANCYMFDGLNQMYLGNNPEKTFNLALKNYDNSKNIAPSFILNYINAGVIYAYLGQYKSFHGADPIDTLEKGIKNFKKAEKIDKNNIYIYSNLGGIYLLLGDYNFDVGNNPLKDYALAIDAYNKALKINPGENSLYVNISGTYISIAEYQLKLKTNPLENLEKAVQNGEKSIKLFKENSFGFINLSSAYLLYAQYYLNSIPNFEKYIDLAMKTGNKALTITPNSVDALETQSKALYEYASFLIKKKKVANGASYLNKSLKLAKKGLKIDSEYSSLYIILAKIYNLKSDLMKTNRNEKLNLLKLAQDSILNGIRLSPKTAYNYKIASDIIVKLAEIEKNPNKSYVKALEYIEKAIKIDPESKKFKTVKNSILKKITSSNSQHTTK